MSQLPPVLPLSFTSPDVDSAGALARPAVSLRALLCNSMYMDRQLATLLGLFILEDLWSQSRTQGHSYASRATQGRKINWARVRLLINHRDFGR